MGTANAMGDMSFRSKLLLYKVKQASNSHLFDDFINNLFLFNSYWNSQQIQWVV
jgi:hypothetical protein